MPFVFGTTTLAVSNSVRSARNMIPSDIAKIISTIGSVAFPDALSAFLRSTAEIDTIVIMAYGKGQPPVPLFDDCPSEKRWRTIDSYISGAYKLDPFYLSSAAGSAAGLYRLKSVAPDHFGRSDYYRTYYKQIGIIDELGYFIPLEAGICIVVSLGKYRRGGEFSGKAFDELGEIEPVVRCSVARNWRSLSLQVPILSDRSSDLFTPLTQREREIALMVLKGYSSEAIALNFSISRQTVKVHRRNIYGKLQISSATELFRLYMNSAGLA
jgi:DNA-binding CsgD family transcriptional regulator